MNFTLEELQHTASRYNLQFIQTGLTEYRLFLRSDIFWMYAFPEWGGYLAPLAAFKTTEEPYSKYSLYDTSNAFLMRDFQTRPPYFCLFRAVTPAEQSHGDVVFLNKEFTYIENSIQFMNYIHWLLDTLPDASKYLKQYKQNKLIEQINEDFV